LSRRICQERWKGPGIYRSRSARATKAESSETGIGHPADFIVLAPRLLSSGETGIRKDLMGEPQLLLEIKYAQAVESLSILNFADRTGGSGLGGGLALSLRNPAEFGTERTAISLPKIQGPAAVTGASCSRATLGRIEHFVKTEKPLAWAKPRLGNRTVAHSRERINGSRGATSAGARSRVWSPDRKCSR
jgi:hypothetical protein